jgi:DNA-3-methyladenine glycosylase II
LVFLHPASRLSKVVEFEHFKRNGVFPAIMVIKFTQSNYYSICDTLATCDPDLATIINTYGYPPFWSRPNTFETLVHIILEQQVSLASALATLNKLRDRLGEITPELMLMLNDDEMRACYVSRQKSAYLRHLAEALASDRLNLVELEEMPDAEIRAKLTALKGIGHWTTDVYLMFVLQHADLFPISDLAAVNAMKKIKNLPMDTTKDQLIQIAEQWRPYRTVATMVLWHFYLSVRRQN